MPWIPLITKIVAPADRNPGHTLKQTSIKGFVPRMTNLAHQSPPSDLCQRLRWPNGEWKWDTLLLAAEWRLNSCFVFELGRLYEFQQIPAELGPPLVTLERCFAICFWKEQIDWCWHSDDSLGGVNELEKYVKFYGGITVEFLEFITSCGGATVVCG